MNPVEKTIDDIKLLIASGDLSDGLHLRQLHRSCIQIFKDLNSNLEQCRTHVENGSIQAARELNCSFDPSLTQIAEYLEFFKGNDFFAVCKEYGLETPTFPDEQLLILLNTPVSSGEKHLHALLQDYRKIARNGTMQQRISLLRKIVKKLPDSARWRNDLISAERSRIAEIEKELAQLSTEKRSCEKLEELFREVMAPEWLLPPKAELIAELRDLLLPLQRANLNKEVELKLQMLQDCMIERDTGRLENELEKWRIFSSNPMISLTPEQKQTIADIEQFCRTDAEEKQKKKTSQDLIRKIEQCLADGGNFSDVSGDYSRLQLLDCQIPPALVDRLKSLEEESSRYEYLSSVRKCIFGICGAILLIIIIIFSVQYTQHYLAVKRNCANMASLLKEQRYDEIIKLHDDLKISSPKIAADSQIILFRTTAVSKKETLAARRQQEEQRFSRLLEQITQLAEKDVLDNAATLDRVFAEARQCIKTSQLKKNLLDKFAALETRVTQRRTALKQQREEAFSAFCRTRLEQIGKLIRQIPQKQPADLDISVKLIEKELHEKLAMSPHVPKHLKEQAKNRFQAAVKKYNEAWKQEKAFRSVNAPSSFDSYLKALEQIQYQYPDLANSYRLAYSRKKSWQQEYENYKILMPETLEQIQDPRHYGEGLFRKDLKKILPKQTRSDVFARFFAGILKQKDMKELIFTTADGKDFFFYTAAPVRIERLRRPSRINITFTANTVGKEKNNRFIVTFSEKKDNMRFVVKSRHQDLPYKLPQGFASLYGQSNFSRENPLQPWPGAELTQRCGALSSDGPGLNHNLRQALQFICEESNIKNAYLKEILIIHFLQALCDSSELYPEIAEKLNELQEFQQSRQRNWRAPQMYKEYAKESEQLQQLWNQLDLKRLLEAGKLRGDFFCAAHARLLVPAGVVQQSENGKIRIHLFAGEKMPREALVFENAVVSALPGEVLRGVLPRDKKWHNMLFKGQIIWRFGDGKSTQDFLREWQQEALKKNIRLKIKPSILPVNLVL